MKIRKVISRPVNVHGKAINIAGGVSGAVSANVNESGSSGVSSRQEVSIIQTPDRNEQHVKTDIKEETR